MRKVLGVRLVHLGKVAHVGQEDVDLDHARHVGAGFGEDGFDVLAAGFGLRGDGAGDERAGRIGGDAARDEDVGAGDDGVGLGRGVSGMGSGEEGWMVV